MSNPIQYNSELHQFRFKLIPNIMLFYKTIDNNYYLFSITLIAYILYLSVIKRPLFRKIQYKKNVFIRFVLIWIRRFRTLI